MSFQVTQGLFSLDNFNDCHAILGVAVTADTNTIRKRYLKIARRLHPDSFIGQDQSYKELATQLFSKLVGPAYNTLCQERDRKEYLLLIQLKGKQAIQQQVSLATLGDIAPTLAQAANLDAAYEQALASLVPVQYEVLTQSLDIIGQLSELNLTYLMLSQGGSRSIPTVPTASATTGNSSSNSTTTSPAAPTETAPSKTASSLDSYLRRAQDYIAQKDFRSATLDLRDALRVDPNDSRCHALMGTLYLEQKNLPMARVSIKRALELDPSNGIALKAKQRLEKLGQKVDVGGSTKRGSSSSTRRSDSKSDQGGGFLGGLFGGKKK